MMKRTVPLLILLALASCNNNNDHAARLSFCPRPDITAYELALIVRINLIAIEDGKRVIKEHPELKRYIVARGECKEP